MSDLGPLPAAALEDHEYERWGQNMSADFFTADQMRAYAAAQVAAEREARLEAQRQLEVLKARIAGAEADKCRAVIAERERCAAICDVTPPYPFRASIEAAYAIRNPP